MEGSASYRSLEEGEHLIISQKLLLGIFSLLLATGKIHVAKKFNISHAKKNYRTFGNRLEYVM